MFENIYVLREYTKFLINWYSHGRLHYVLVKKRRYRDDDFINYLVALNIPGLGYQHFIFYDLNIIRNNLRFYLDKYAQKKPRVNL